MEISLKDKAQSRSARLLSGVALAALLAGWSIPAQAASDPETLAEIRALKAKLHQLEHRMDAQAQTQRRESAKAGAAAPAGGSGVVVQSSDGRFWPDKFTYKGITITPGGFIALESVWRSRWVGADINTNFANIPYGFNGTAHSNEFRFSARQSRLSMLVQGDIDPLTHISGYVETDFLGAAQTANSNESNSYNLRLRQMYTNIDWDEWGLHLAAGQTWSLTTLSPKGLKADSYLLPPTIDAQYVPGFVWARQPGIRLVKDFGKQFWVAVSAESGATTWALPGATFFPGQTTALPIYATPILFGAAQGGGLFNGANNYSFNHMPDFVGKAAWDANIFDRNIHVEAFGLLRDITDHAYFGDHSQWGGGFGAGVVVPIVPKLLDVQVSGMTGRGIGRYGSGQLADATFSLTGAPQLTHERMLLVGATLHATPQTDIYAFAGGEFLASQYQFNRVGGTLFVGGYGNPFYNNIGCNIENDAVAAGGVALNAALSGCAGQISALRQITGGVWHTVYNGPFGKVKAGAQYSYTKKTAFPGVELFSTPQATENMWYLSLRYYPFDGPTPVLAAKY